MDFRRPLQVVSPTLDGDVLEALSRADAEFSGGELHRLIGHSSEEGVRRAAERLAGQGIVLRRKVARAYLYRLNREHVAAHWVEGLAALRTQVFEGLRTEVGAWQIPPMAALLFGSVARGEASPRSDLDLLVVRPRTCDPDEAIWRDQLADIQRVGTALTGNDTRVVEFDESELSLGTPEPLIETALAEGIEIFGDRRALRRLTVAP